MGSHVFMDPVWRFFLNEFLSPRRSFAKPEKKEEEKRGPQVREIPLFQRELHRNRVRNPSPARLLLSALVGSSVCVGRFWGLPQVKFLLYFKCSVSPFPSRVPSSTFSLLFPFSFRLVFVVFPLGALSSFCLSFVNSF